MTENTVGSLRRKRKKQYSVLSRYTLIVGPTSENKNWNRKMYLPAYYKLKEVTHQLAYKEWKQTKFYRPHNIIIISSIKHHLKVDTIRSHFNLYGLKFLSKFHSGRVNIPLTQHSQIRILQIFFHKKETACIAITDTFSPTANGFFVLFCSWEMCFFL